MVTNDAHPPRDHNQPPEPILDLDEIDQRHLLALPFDRLREFLKLRFGPLVQKRDAYVASADRWIAAHSRDNGISVPTIAMDGYDGPDTLDLKRTMETFISDKGEVLAAKDSVKRELLDACHLIERFFVDYIKEPVAAKHRVIQNAYTSHVVHETRLRDEAARKAAEEATANAARLASIAQQISSGATHGALLAKAEAELQAAREANAAVAAPLAERSRQRGFSNTVSGLRELWGWRVKEPDGKLALIKAVAEGRESPDLLALNDTLLRALAKAKDKREPVGIEFYSEKKAR